MSVLRIRTCIVALRDERGSYNGVSKMDKTEAIVALRDERGSYNLPKVRRIFR